MYYDSHVLNVTPGGPVIIVDLDFMARRQVNETASWVLHSAGYEDDSEYKRIEQDNDDIFHGARNRFEEVITGSAKRNGLTILDTMNEDLLTDTEIEDGVFWEDLLYEEVLAYREDN